MFYKKRKRRYWNKNSSLKNHRRTKRTYRKTRRYAKPRHLGNTYVNGKFYDTNFKKPHRITKDELEYIRKEYPGRNDKEKVENFVDHMRIKYGIYDINGNFVKMMGE